jgi:PleD family two-component response regulator
LDASGSVALCQSEEVKEKHMPVIVLLSPQAASWLDFVNTLKKELGADIETARSGAEALELAREKNPMAIIVDQGIEDLSGFGLVHQLMTINAMINVAWVSDLPADTFHEKTEGLGILMQLSPHPDLSEACQLAESLRQITGVI